MSTDSFEEFKLCPDPHVLQTLVRTAKLDVFVCYTYNCDAEVALNPLGEHGQL